MSAVSLLLGLLLSAMNRTRVREWVLGVAVHCVLLCTTPETSGSVERAVVSEPCTMTLLPRGRAVGSLLGPCQSPAGPAMCSLARPPLSPGPSGRGELAPSLPPRRPPMASQSTQTVRAPPASLSVCSLCPFVSGAHARGWFCKIPAHVLPLILLVTATSLHANTASFFSVLMGGCRHVCAPGTLFQCGGQQFRTVTCIGVDGKPKPDAQCEKWGLPKPTPTQRCGMSDIAVVLRSALWFEHEVQGQHT